MDDTMYREEILNHYQHPHNTGKPATFSHTCKKDNPFCGDEIEVFLTIESGVIRDIHFLAKGCAISVASASMLSDIIKGWSAERVAKLSADDILKVLKIELTPTRLKCALLPLEVLQASLSLK